MSRKIANRQATAMLNAPPFEANIGIHNVPFIGFEAVIRQHFARRLNAFSPFFCSDRFDFSAPFPESTPINGPSPPAAIAATRHHLPVLVVAFRWCRPENRGYRYRQFAH